MYGASFLCHRLDRESSAKTTVRGPWSKNYNGTAPVFPRAGNWGCSPLAVLKGWHPQVPPRFEAVSFANRYLFRRHRCRHHHRMDRAFVANWKRSSPTKTGPRQRGGTKEDQLLRYRRRNQVEAEQGKSCRIKEPKTRPNLAAVRSEERPGPRLYKYK